MVESVEKCKKVKKRVIKWDQIVFYLNNPEISGLYLSFKTRHLTMSNSRCAFYILKGYYSTTLLRFIRRCYRNGLTYEECIQWIDHYSQPRLVDEVPVV